MHRKALAFFLLITLSLCHSVFSQVEDDVPVPSGIPEFPSWYADADKLFPKPPTLLEYERILSEYDTGKIKETVPEIESLAKRPLILASVEAWAEDPEAYVIYSLRRLFPAQAAIRRVWCTNQEYARQLGKENKRSEAMAILLVNVSIARQVAQIRPLDTVSLISGHMLWRYSWTDLRDELRAMGDQENAEIAATSVKQAAHFSDRRLWPSVNAGSLLSERLLDERSSIRKSKREEWDKAAALDYRRSEERAAFQLVALWDMEVDTPACRQLVKELQREYQTDTALTPAPAK